MTLPEGAAPGPATAPSSQTDPEQVARSILLRQLTSGPRTRAQLREALAKRAVPDEVAERLLFRFTEVGLVDDRAFAAEMIRSQASAGGLSRRRVAHRLLQKGVSKEIAESAVAAITPEQEYAAAVELAERHMRRMTGLPPVAVQRRLAGVLGRRGYPADTVRRVVTEATAGLAGGASPADG